MQIDWLTVAAQWVNFLLLMWLLKRFLYRPITQAMERRRQSIENSRLEAEEKAQQAEELAESYRNKLAELEAHRSVFMAAAREAAETERENLLTEARAEIEALSRQWRLEVEREKTEFERIIRQELGRLALNAAGKALADLTGLQMEQALQANFLSRLQALPERDKRLLSGDGSDDLILASSAELDAGARSRFTDALRGTLGAQTAIRFEPLPDSALGLVLSSPDYTLEWRLETYFQSLSTELERHLATPGQNHSANHAA